MVLILALILACICFPSIGFSENKSAGFYAGPLSTAAETIVEVTVQKSAAEKTPQPTEEKDIHVH